MKKYIDLGLIIFDIKLLFGKLKALTNILVRLLMLSMIKGIL